MSLTGPDEPMSGDLLDGLPRRAAGLAARIEAVCPLPNPVEDLHDVVRGLGENPKTLTLVELLTAELSQARQAVADLTNALQSNREIGAATGVLMALRHVTQPEAFDLLRVTSQTRHVKLRELAREVVETGSLNVPPTPAKGSNRHRSTTSDHRPMSPAAGGHREDSPQAP